MAIVSYTSFSSVAQDFAAYTQRVRVVAIARDTDREFVNMRRLVRDYAAEGQDSVVEAAQKQRLLLQEIFTRGLKEIKNPERHKKFEEMSRAFDEYYANFEKVVKTRREQDKLMKDTLDPTGTQMRVEVEAVQTALTNAGDVNGALLAAEASKT